MAEKDYYNIMGISKNATDDDIKKAYRTLVKKYHPDLNPDSKEAEAKMKDVNEAYSILSDKEKRARYDQFGQAGVDPNFNGGTTYSGGAYNSDFDINDILNDFFGGFGGGRVRRTNPNAPQRGGDMEASLTISFEEAAKGSKKNITYERMENCLRCHGSGGEPGSAVNTCPQCNGAGQVKATQRTPFGVVQTNQICSKCQGKGKVIEQTCKICHGQGRTKIKKSIEVTIPAGIDNNQILNISGQGDTGINHGPNGDLHLYINVRPHAIFKRRGNDVWCDMNITLTQAALGSEMSVPTLDGNVSYHIHEGTQPNDVFKLKGKGIPHLRGRGRGDQYVHIHVEIPKNLSQKQKDLLKEFEAVSNDKNYQKKKGFFGKFK